MNTSMLPPYTLQILPYPDNYEVSFRSSQLIEVPPEAPLTLAERIQTVVRALFRCVTCFFSALGEATYQTLRYTGVSFKYIVLGYYGDLRNFRPPADIYLAAFKVAVWVLAGVWCLTVTTGRLFLEKMAGPSSTHPSLSRFSGDEIDPHHLITHEVALDASRVPATITVDTLTEIFQEINFTREGEAGYINESSRQEGGAPYSVVTLKERLDLFIKRVKTREAFLATPPAYDVPRLMAFYQQIEDAVRLSIDKAQKELDAFKQKNGEDSTRYDEKQKIEYDLLLTSKAHIALDLAIAAGHCGARYMGETMAVYDGLYRETTASLDGSLEHNLTELLARKRYEIAQAQIAEGGDAANPHTFANYMGNLGKVLGLPGTQDISEHYAQSFDLEGHLEKFFNVYTVDTIIDTVNEAVKRSQHLREQISDWARDQAKGWRKEHYAQLKENTLAAINTIIHETVSSSSPSPLSPAEKLYALIDGLQKEGIPLPTNELEDPENGWENFLSTLLAEEPAKARIANQYRIQHNVDPNRMQLLQMKSMLQAQWRTDALGNETVELFKRWLQGGQSIPSDFFAKQAQTTQKIKKIRAQLDTLDNNDSIARLLKNRDDLLANQPGAISEEAWYTALNDVVESHIHNVRGRDFFDALHLQDVYPQEAPGEEEDPEENSDEIHPENRVERPPQKDLSREFMEWLLVSHHILHPQP